ncbi:MAG: 3-isopropylmalate dehydrogenase, partial [Gammaproteobacteria bacterium]|nr:3-isopropylmalate dehydrogenase [Gammaproteobacteria bacterium]
MKRSVTVLPGDGIGPEVTAQAAAVLQAAAARFDAEIALSSALIGGAAIDAENSPLPETSLASCEKSDAIFLGAVGGPQWANVPANLRPEQGLLDLRRALGLFAN